MHRLSNRLASFKDWPSEAEVEPLNLAEAGFYYTRIDDIVRCCCCELEIGGWKDIHLDPWIIHRQKSESCLFLSVKKWCCELRCFPTPRIQVDGIACTKCNSYCYCRCKCNTWLRTHLFPCTDSTSE